MSNSLRSYGLQGARLLCPPLSPGVCSNSCPLSRWCYWTISASVTPFSSCLQSFLTSGAFLMNLLFSSGGQTIGVSASASVLPMNIQGWFSLGWTDLISLRSMGLLRVSSSTTIQKNQFFSTQPTLLFISYLYAWLLEKLRLWIYRPLSAKWCLCFLTHCLGLSQLFF